MSKLPDAQNTPSRGELQLAKEPRDAPAAPSERAGLARHFAGYELWLGTVSVVLTLALIALPRPSPPSTLPLPRVDRGEARASAQAERELAARATLTGLPFEVRAVGESVRRLGRAAAGGLDTSHEQDDMRTRVKAALDAHDTPLLIALRAVQTGYFVNAVRDFERTGRSSPELDDLGGDFLAQARHSGWLDARGHFVGDEAILRILFHLRFARLLGRRNVFPFSATLNEWRSYYRFLLKHPPRASRAALPDDATSMRLRVVVALGHKDPEYPLELARGYLLYRLGSREESATAYRRYLGTHDGGAYALRARNHLIYALQDVGSE